MLQHRLRPAVTAFITPLCRGLIKGGLKADHMTWIGAIGASLSALLLFPAGKFFEGTLLVTIFALTDLLDGTMARLSNSGGTRWGALLDSTLDRVTDAAILIGILGYTLKEASNLSFVVLANLVTGSLIPYIRSRAEGLGLSCSVGIAERTERLIIILVATALYGFSLSFALGLGMYVLLILSLITIAQRIAHIRKAS